MRILTKRATEGRIRRARHAHGAERTKTRIMKGDVVKILRGDDKGKEGKVLEILPKTNRVLVEGINIVKKHRRARTAEEQSGIIEKPAPMALSNVMLIDPKSGKATRIKARIDADGTKERLSVKSGESIARPAR
jgi:large subunit ribosomal protein L24